LKETIAASEGHGAIIRQSQVSLLPKVLFVRFSRFFWKSKEATKAKILKKVQFPLEFSAQNLTSLAPENSMYRLCGVVTHAGRTADSGHYICWTVKNGSWWKIDDDKVSPVSEADIKKLDGGGDWHMAYICLYELIDQGMS
jgi:ubiquitin carboxyl-terminal hydrolase 14